MAQTVDELQAARLEARELASLIEEAHGSDTRGHGNRAGALLTKFAGGRSRLERPSAKRARRRWC